MTTPDLVLASTSPYRKQLLEQLGIDFRSLAPDFEETPRQDEAPAAMALRQGTGKAESVLAQLASPAFVIGSDQVCHLQEEVFPKPGDEKTAFAHLRRFSGNWVTFSTSVVLLTPSGGQHGQVETFRVHFRELADEQIRRYLAIDQPYDCAGAIKVEHAGITLLDDMAGRDINALYGLPMIALTDLFEREGISILDFKKHV